MNKTDSNCSRYRNMFTLRLFSCLILSILACSLVGCKKTPDKLPIDDIKGFKSIILGSTAGELSDRIDRFSPEMVKYKSELGVISQLTEDETTWGEVPVKRIMIWFEFGVASRIQVEFNNWGEPYNVLQKAFEQKYGKPSWFSDSEFGYTRTWQGNDITVEFTRTNGIGGDVVFSSARVKREIDSKQQTLKQERERNANEKAKDVIHKL